VKKNIKQSRYNSDMNSQKDYLTDLVDEVDNDNQDNEPSQDLDDDQAISDDGDVITLDY